MKQESPFQVAASQSGRTVGDQEYAFNRLRRRLEKIACRMLGSVAEAEDIVQETWLRWNAAAWQEIENEEAWLVSVTRRLSIDRLRAIKIQYEHCTELWLPGPQMTEFPATPQEINERADDVSMAYLVLLERLTHEARAAFLMYEVFNTDYDQIAETLHKTPEACRKLVSRARAQLHDKRPQFAVPQETHHHLLKIFVQVLERGDFAEITSFLAEEAALMADGAGRMTGLPKQDGQSCAHAIFHAVSGPLPPPSSVRLRT